MRIMDHDIGAALPEFLDHLLRGRVARVVRVLAVCETEDGDAGPLDLSTRGREAFFDQPGHPLRHVVVHGSCGRDELGLRLNRRRNQEPRVLRDAMASDPGSGNQHHPKGASVDQVANAVRIHAEFLADQRDLVREGELDVPIRVLGGLHDLRGRPVRGMEFSVHEASVEGEGLPQGDGLVRTDDPRQFGQMVQELPGRETFGAVDEMHIAADFHLGRPFQGGSDHGLHRARGEGGLDRHECTALQMRTDAREGGLEGLVGRVVGGRFDRSLDTYRDDVRVRGLRGIKARAQAVLRDLLLEKTLKTRLVTPKRALTHVDRVDFPGVDVDAHDARARRGDRGRERHPDIAEADYADLHERAHVASFG